MTNKRPLEGVRIADFTWIGAGSYATKLMADLGAEVIKIESRTYPDSLRLAAPFVGGTPGINRSGYFADRNTSKRSIALNMKVDSARALARELVLRSDIVANNFAPGTMEKFGLAYEDLHAAKPELVYLAMSMQGQDGPERDSMGYGLTIAALTGLQFMSGLPGRVPAGTGTNYPDHIPNPTHAAFATLAALRHARRTGQGQRVEIAQTEPVIAMLGPTIADAAVNGAEHRPAGNRSDRFAPQGVYPCEGSDRWLALSVRDDAQWQALVDLLGGGGLNAMRGLDAEGRRGQHERIDGLIGERTARWDRRELMEQLQRVGIASGVVQDARDVLQEDPQLRHREHWVTLRHAEMGETSYNNQPYRLADCEVAPRTPAPLLGEHTEEVCREVLGFDSARIEQLRSEGAIG